MKLINKNDKFYKECGVIILEKSTGKSNLIINKRYETSYINSVTNGCKSYGDKYINLYFTSDDKCNDGDWYIWTDNKQICQADCMLMTINNHIKNGHIKKIIATTDPSLNLHSPSNKFIQAFIDAYNNGEKIENVLVEYDRIKYLTSTLEPNEYNVKLEDNNIVIELIKESWTKEEIISMLKSISPEKYDLPEFDKDGDAVSNVEWGILKDKVKQTAIIDRLISEL